MMNTCVDGSDTIRNNAEDPYSRISKLLIHQLEVAETKWKDVEAEIDEYNGLLHQLMLLKDRYEVHTSDSYSDEPGNTAPSEMNSSGPLEVLVDLGYQISYCKAEIDNPRIIYVHVGLGCHVEFTLSEAINFISRRLDFLKLDALPKRAHIARQFAIDIDRAISSLNA